MERNIFLIRHAKSDQNFFSKDFERPLNERGNRDAPIMAKRLKIKQPAIDRIICSPANRTLTTAKYFASEYEIDTGSIITEPVLYQAAPDAFVSILEELPDNVRNVIIIAHNPAISLFANSVVKEADITDMPTCAIFAFRATIASWKVFPHSGKEFLFFDYPKLH